MSNRNTILENAPKLANGLRWELIKHSWHTFKFNNFFEFEDMEQVIFKQEKTDGIWLVELIRDNVIYFGFVKIVKK